MTPFEVVYGVPPPRLLNYIPGTTRVEAMEEVLGNREHILSFLQYNMKKAQNRMKKICRLKKIRKEIQDWASSLLAAPALSPILSGLPAVPNACCLFLRAIYHPLQGW
jgi:hypothetical protein